MKMFSRLASHPNLLIESKISLGLQEIKFSLKEPDLVFCRYLPESSIHGLNPQIFPFLQSIRLENWQISKLLDHLLLFEVSLEAYEHLSYLPKSKAEPQLRVDFGQPGPGIFSEIDM